MAIQQREISKYDPYSNTGEERTIGPAKEVFSITLDQEFASISRGLLIGVAGNVAVKFLNGNEKTIPLTAGWHPIEVIQVNTTGTTATGLFYFI